MVTDLDFEEIDDLMGQMSDTQDLAEAIAADVAKVSPKPTRKKTTKKSASKPASVVDSKPEPVAEPIPEPEDTIIPQVVIAKSEKAADDPVVKKPVKKDVSKPLEQIPEEDPDGTKVSVRVLTKYVEEPDEPVYKPNPRTGRFMDFVDPKNDMTITRQQQPSVMIPVATVVETHETIIETIEEIPEVSADEEHDRDRLERNGLDPDATVEEMMEMAEPEDGDAFLEEMMNNLGEDIEDEPTQEIAKDDNTADILDFQDRSDAFLTEVDIEKRPLGGSAVANSVMVADEKEVAANNAFINEDSGIAKPDNNTLSKKEQKKLKKDAEKQAKIIQAASAKPQKKGRAGQTLLYIALMLLLAVLGGSLGALAYFSGLF